LKKFESPQETGHSLSSTKHQKNLKIWPLIIFKNSKDQVLNKCKFEEERE